MLKYADILKLADAPGKGMNSPLYKRTGIDPAMPGAKDRHRNRQRARAYMEKLMSETAPIAHANEEFVNTLAGLNREGQGIRGKIHEEFWGTLPGIWAHVNTIPEYLYRLGAMHKRMYRMERQPNESAVDAVRRMWNETGEDLREDSTRNWLTFSGDTAKASIYDPVKRFLRKTNPVKAQTEQLEREHPASAALAGFGGNALGWAALPGAGEAAAAAIGRVPGKVGETAPIMKQVVGGAYNRIGADNGIFDTGNVLKATGMTSPDTADKLAWGASAARQAMDATRHTKPVK